MITSIDHIVLTSKDVDKTIFFYCDILGMKLEENIDEYKGKKRIYLNGRKNLIQRSINNLIDNSLKYGEKTKLILEKKKSNIFISIEDDGPGIPKSEYENVIKPFYKIDKGRSETKSSVGLGLSISSDIIKSHGGDIKFAKSNLGGLKVMISLPV